MKIILLSLALFPSAGSVAGQTTPILFQRVRVFDGLQVTASTDVLIRDGRIQDIGQELKDPSAQIVDGTGKTSSLRAISRKRRSRANQEELREHWRRAGAG
jgi:dihydroorotase-like cyclic amidohydrolase